MRTVESEQSKAETLQHQRRPSLVTSALSNWAPLGVNILITLLLWPYLIKHLGKGRFGVWTLVGSFIGYFGLLRLGVGTGIMRYVPFYVGRNDQKAAGEIISTGLAMYLLVGLTILSVSMLLAEPIARFYKAGPELVALVRIMGLAAAIECPLLVFDAGLKAQERWIVGNSITIIAAVMRGLGFAACIYFGYGLVEMGYVVLSLTAFSLILTTIVFVRLCPTIRLRAWMVRLSRLRELLFYGLLTMVVSLAYSMGLQSHKLIIGKLVSLEAVTIYAVAAVLVERVRGIVWAPLQVTWPRFALLDGENNHGEIISLFRRATLYGTVLVSGIILLVVVAGPCFIRLWVPDEDFTAAYPVLMVLSIGCLVEGSFFANTSLLGATGRQGANALFRSIQGVTGLILSILLGLRMGMFGVAIGYTISLTLVHGVAYTWYVCHLLKISMFRYYVGYILRPWLILGSLVMLVYYTGILEYVHTWSSLLIFVIVFGCLYALCAFAVAMNRQERKKVLGIIRQLFTYVLVLINVKRENYVREINE